MATAITEEGRRQQDQREAGQKPVECAFDQPLASAEFGLLHVQQGQPGDRADRRTGARDVEQRGRHTKLGAGPLKRPAKLAQPVAVHLRARQHRDGIGAEIVHRHRDAVQAAEDGDVGDLRWPACLGQARAHDGHAVIAAAAQHGRQFGDRRRMADHDHPPQALASVPHPVQVLAQPVPHRQVQQRGRRHGQGHVAARHVELERVGGNRDGGGQAHRRVENAPEFVRADTDETGVISPGQSHRSDPQQRKCAGEDQVGGRLRTVAQEARLNRQDTGDDGAGHIAHRGPPQVGPGPGGGILGGAQCLEPGKVTSDGRLLSHRYRSRPVPIGSFWPSRAHDEACACLSPRCCHRRVPACVPMPT